MKPKGKPIQKVCVFSAPKTETGKGETKTILGQPALRVNRDLSAFFGFNCPHYRERPYDVSKNVPCNPCRNRLVCIRLDKQDREIEQRASSSILETGPEVPNGLGKNSGPQESNANTRRNHNQPDANGFGNGVTFAGVPTPNKETDWVNASILITPFQPSFRGYAIATQALSIPVPITNPNQKVGAKANEDPTRKPDTETMGDERDRERDTQTGTVLGPQIGKVADTTTVGTKHRKLPILREDGRLNTGAMMEDMPRIECNSCFLAEECPEYKEDSPCAFNLIEDQFDMTTVEGQIGMVDFLLQRDKTRTFRQVLVEQMTTGGLMDGKTSQAMDRMRNSIATSANLRALINAQENPPALTTDRHSITVTEEVTRGPGKPQINPLVKMMQSLMGGGGKTERDTEDDAIDAEAEVVSRVKNEDSD